VEVQECVTWLEKTPIERICSLVEKLIKNSRTLLPQFQEKMRIPKRKPCQYESHSKPSHTGDSKCNRRTSTQRTRRAHASGIVSTFKSSVTDRTQDLKSISSPWPFWSKKKKNISSAYRLFSLTSLFEASVPLGQLEGYRQPPPTSWRILIGDLSVFAFLLAVSSLRMGGSFGFGFPCAGRKSQK